MHFRPCIDIHNGQVKQIIGSTLTDNGAGENFVSGKGAEYFAGLYRRLDLPGGHVIILNKRDSAEYEAGKREAFKAFGAYPDSLEAGGGITPSNAREFLDAGASKVIVTSYIFRDGQIDPEALEAISRAAGKDRLVLDLSCRKINGRYMVVTDRWQTVTDTEMNPDTLQRLSDHCSGYLIHAYDAEGKGSGPDREVIRILSEYEGLPVTYAGGIGSFDDIRLIEREGKGKIDFTVGSRLDIFGGDLSIEEIACRWGHG